MLNNCEVSQDLLISIETYDQKRPRVLDPLTDEVGKYGDKDKKIMFKWKPEIEKVFKLMKLPLATDAMLGGKRYGPGNRPYWEMKEFIMICI